MASSYPTGLDSFSTSRTTGQVVAAATDNDHSDAINKVEAELGTNPSGADTTVAARFSNSVVHCAIHNGTSYPARPTAASVMWIGPTDPGASAQDTDLWVPTA